MKNVNTEIAECLIGMNVLDQVSIDKAMIELDGTPTEPSGRQRHSGRLPGLCQGCRRVPGRGSVQLYRRRQRQAAACSYDEHSERRCSCHQQRGDPGVHDCRSLPSFREALRRCAEVFHQLKTTLKENGTPAAGVGDEGGYAPNLKKDEDALKVIVAAIEKAGYKPGEDFKIAIDAASSEWWNDEEKCYIQPKSGKKLTQQQLVKMWKNFAEKYPIISSRTAWPRPTGRAGLTKAIGDRVQLVGDDLFVTNVERLSTGIEKKVANSILIKVNQIGSLTETLDAIQMANRATATPQLYPIVPARPRTQPSPTSPWPERHQIKTGAPSRTDRVAKYNQLLRIEEELGDIAEYPGMKAFFNLK